MSRKSVDQQQPTECRQAVWDEIRRQAGIFTQNDLDVRLEPSSIRDYLQGLCAAGYLERGEKGRTFTATEYRLVSDIGIEAPRVRRDGTPVTQGQGRQQMWNAMRVLKNFSVMDLAFNSSTDDCLVAESDAKGYIGNLCKAGYLRQTSAGKPGHKPGTGTKAHYMLIPSMWTGPHPPQIQRTKQVYDPNLKRVVWAKVEGGAE